MSGNEQITVREFSKKKPAARAFSWQLTQYPDWSGTLHTCPDNQ